MRHRNIWAAGLALGLGLCMVGIALGQDPSGSGNWLTRLFTRSPAAPAQKDDREPVVPALTPAAQRAQANADFLRRLEICDKLRAAAAETGDMELASKADLLEMRAKDAYIQRVNRAGGLAASVDEQTLEKNLAPKGTGLTPLSSAAANKAGTGQALMEGR